MKSLTKFLAALSLFLITFVSAQKDNALLDQIASKSVVAVIMFSKNHSSDDFVNFSDKFNSSSQEEQITLLKEYLGSNYDDYINKALEIKTLTDKFDKSSYTEEEIKEFIVNKNYDYTLSYTNAKVNPKPDIVGYNLCSASVIAGSVVAGFGCTAVTAGIGVAICMAGVHVMAQTGIALCAHNYLHNP